MSSKIRITKMLQEAQQGDQEAHDKLIKLVYSELRGIAQRQLNREYNSPSLNPTALVHEAYIKLINQSEITYQDRHHFYGICGRLMRQVLVDKARRRNADKRGGKQKFVTLNRNTPSSFELDVDKVLMLEKALSELESDRAEAARLVELRFFAGFSLEESATALGLSHMTARRRWDYAKDFLKRVLV